jgi:hypothetical protein
MDILEAGAPEVTFATVVDPEQPETVQDTHPAASPHTLWLLLCIAQDG